MTHSSRNHPCPRQIRTRTGTTTNPWKPVRTTARTPLRGMTPGRCAASPLAGHRTPSGAAPSTLEIAARRAFNASPARSMSMRLWCTHGPSA